MISAIMIIVAFVLIVCTLTIGFCRLLQAFFGWSVPAALLAASCILPVGIAIHAWFALEYAKGIADGDPTAGIVEVSLLVMVSTFCIGLCAVAGWEWFKRPKS